MAGSLAGSTAVACTYPLDLIRARLAYQYGGGGAGSYSGIIDAMRTILKEGGIRSLYAGLGPTLVGIVPYAGINFFAYERQKGYWVNVHPGKSDADIPTPLRLIMGAAAGATGQTATYPIDLVRRRMQIVGMGNTLHQYGGGYKGTWDALSRIVRSEGFFAIFRGLSLNYLKVAPIPLISVTI